MWGKKIPAAEPIGLIAGAGEFPILFAEAASSKNRLVVFGVKGCTDRRIERFASETHYLDLGGLSTLMELLKKTGVRHVVLAGSIPKKEMYNPSFEPDAMAGSFIAAAKNRGDDHLLRAFQVFLKVKGGVSVMDSRVFLKEDLASKGVLTRRNPAPEEWADLKLGWRVAKNVGRMDIGQTVVVRRGVVLAVEALEGTDQAIRRGAELGGGNVVVVKVSKPNQNLRFDLPCVGLKTLETLKSVSSRVLGVEAGKTLMLSKRRVIEAADAEGVAVVGL